MLTILTVLLLIKREKIMPIYPNDAKYYAGIIYKGLSTSVKPLIPCIRQNALFVG